VGGARGPRPDSRRITLTLPVFNAAAAVIFLVSGAEKAGTLAAVLDPASPPDAFPCQRIRPRDGELIWLVDRPAAAALRTSRIRENPPGPLFS
jgi:6-phosphogluconolactonase